MNGAAHLDPPDAEDAAALRDVPEDLAAGVIAAAAPVVLRDHIQAIRIQHARHAYPRTRDSS